ncbi:hypothetical protein [Bradyrhizobium sp. LMTR 3]|uniref:hypothetical protein n=1 Tax=Bradyrhizobium sp. LMTR 3 TaxID=189873 RepID=UPI000810F2A5|nr:hypothetical protein [Bradyrhizobium sp. LMTR 3]OCK53877.1 hypothetical protein LMTR3_21985 [Bradyrhizobium sp. LMTR 3]
MLQSLRVIAIEANTIILVQLCLKAGCPHFYTKADARRTPHGEMLAVSTRSISHRRLSHP